MSAPRTVPLRDLHRNAFVEAHLHETVDPAFAKRAEDAWSTYLAQRKAAVLAAGGTYVPPENAHWEWEKKVRLTEPLLSYITMGIEFEDHVQGLMMLVTDGHFGRLPEQIHAPLVYVYLLASAPWNLQEVVDKPRFTGVGTVMIRAAMEISLDLGFMGRIGLHSLPRAERWYERRGFSSLGMDADKRMKYYEMTAAQSATFMS